MATPNLSYLNVSEHRAKVVCTCGWESEEFRKGPFDPGEALVAYSVEHLKCLEGPIGVSDSNIMMWPWESAPKHLKDFILTADGDEDGMAWVPAKFRNPIQYGAGFNPPIERIWMTFDDAPEIVEFESGCLVVWRHA